MIYKNRSVCTATDCGDIYVESDSVQIYLTQQAAEVTSSSDLIQITSLDDCNRLIEILQSMKGECWKEPRQ